MQIRTATPEDVDAVHALGEHVAEFSVNEATITFWPKDLLRSAIEADDVLILVAKEQSVIGFLIVNCNRGLKKALIENVYVHPNARGQGIGGQLLQKMFAALPEMGCEYVATLVPLDAGSAINLYEQNDFARGESFLWLDRSLSNSFKRQN